jgi:hypothetical protein
MRRTYEVSGWPPNQTIRQIGRISPDELASWGYSETDEQPRAVIESDFQDKATSWSTERQAFQPLWVGELYEGCDTCGCPVYEHVPGQQQFIGSLRISGNSGQPINLRVACEQFS